MLLLTATGSGLPRPAVERVHQPASHRKRRKRGNTQRSCKVLHMSSARTHARTRDIGQFGGQSEAGAEARDRLDEMRPPSHSSSNADDGPGTTTTTTTMTAMTVAGSGSTTSTGRKKERQGRPNKGERRKKETKKERKKEREKKGKKTATSDPASPPRQISIRHQQIAARRADGWR